MRTALMVILLSSLAIPLPAQPMQRARPVRGAQSIELAVRSTIEALSEEKRLFERDLKVLAQLRQADVALTDPTQPMIAIQKAYEHVAAAKDLNPEGFVYRGIIKAANEIEAARRSPGAADFGRLRSIVSSEATGPASRVVVRNALRLEEEILTWLKIQDLIGQHVRALSEITGESLRAVQ